MKNYLVWGPWVLIKDVLVLRHQRTAYEIYLDECTNSAQVLDWIAQISRKGDDAYPKEEIGDLVRALDDVLDLQGCICGSGADQTITIEKVKEKVNSARGESRYMEEIIEAARKRLNAGRK